jgi:ribosomal protein S18 acetylase RimI-like enzyme
MSSLAALTKNTEMIPPSAEANSPVVQALTGEHMKEVFSFLAARPIHTVYMVGLIRDNGLVNPLNRGTFYGCRNGSGELEGVGLIGHATLFETRSDAALAALAKIAQSYPRAHLVFGEREKIEEFWRHFSKSGSRPRLLSREILLEMSWPMAVHEPIAGLRRATLEDLALIMPVHAQMAFDESGVNPSELDPIGFRLRCAQRIEQGRVWVWIENGRLLFKADVVSDTPEVVYLEGIYVNPEERQKGIGFRCLSQLSRQLLAHTRSIGVVANEQNMGAVKLYERAGFKLQGCYDTIFLQTST